MKWTGFIVGGLTKSTLNNSKATEVQTSWLVSLSMGSAPLVPLVWVNLPNIQGVWRDEIWWWRAFWQAQPRRWAPNSLSAHKPVKKRDRYVFELTQEASLYAFIHLHKSYVVTHVMQQLLQVLLQLAEVDAGNETLPWLGQAVSGQLRYLVVDEAQDPVGEWQHALWGIALDEHCQPLLHLSSSLIKGEKVVNTQVLYYQTEPEKKRQSSVSQTSEVWRSVNRDYCMLLHVADQVITTQRLMHQLLLCPWRATGTGVQEKMSHQKICAAHSCLSFISWEVISVPKSELLLLNPA